MTDGVERQGYNLWHLTRVEEKEWKCLLSVVVRFCKYNQRHTFTFYMFVYSE